MVLVVKLKNPNRRIDVPENHSSPAAESASSQEYTSALEQDRSPTPPASSLYAPIYPQIEVHGTSSLDGNKEEKPDANVDAALDELSSALQQAQIGNDHVQAVKEESPVKTSSRPAVDVLIAPAVLGHRWIRTRSNSFVVERPERVRAVSLGIAALLAKLQSMDEKLKDRLESITSSLAALNVDTMIDQTDSGPLSVHLCRASLSLANPSPALKMIHALEEEYLSTKEIKDPSPYHLSHAKSEAAEIRNEAPLPYTSYLDNLCSQAPSDVPPPPPPRSARSGISPNKVEEGYPTESHHPSEIPLHLSQGDLYLCGSKQENNGYFAQDKLAIGEDSTASPSALPRTPDESAEMAASADNDDESNEHWTKEGSRGAIEAALGTGCAAVDRVVSAALGIRAASGRAVQRVDLTALHRANSITAGKEGSNEDAALRSFVLVRPPGHHCNATQPSGFCWVNNVAVMAAHAYEQHGIDRVAILDFDLHHGNGTQAIAWRINAETVRHDLEREAKIKSWRSEQERKSRKGRKSGGVSVDGGTLDEEIGPPSPLQSRRGLKIFYGSLHDIESFPCEDGNKELVTDASMCIDGAHGQWIWNVHLDASSSVEEAQRLYDAKYSQLLHKAQTFFSKTDSSPGSSLVLISAGFDACTHETPGMQRHGKNVPPQFYEIFTRDAVAMADQFCAGKCVSILEGGYSDRALTSGAIAHLMGLGVPGISEDLYQSSNLYQLEKVAKMASTGQQRRKADVLAKEGVWLDYAAEAIRRLDELCGKKRVKASSTAPVTPTRAMLDELWKSPRETRRGGAGIKPSPIK